MIGEFGFNETDELEEELECTELELGELGGLGSYPELRVLAGFKVRLETLDSNEDSSCFPSSLPSSSPELLSNEERFAKSMIGGALTVPDRSALGEVLDPSSSSNTAKAVPLRRTRRRIRSRAVSVVLSDKERSLLLPLELWLIRRSTNFLVSLT
jgi:hypothetical protein